MDWVLHEPSSSSSSSSSQRSYFLLQQPPPPPTSSHSGDLSLSNSVSPSILLIIIILAIIFFVSGLLHLLVRFLMRPPSTVRDQEDPDGVTALQGQLQQLFHLHDAGVDQSFIDALPVFFYKAIIGLKNPFDCAVCLCEFEPEDKLRLLPKCSHAFHMECIDTWLLSHSTCPLCRANLLPDFSPAHIGSPIVLVLESGRESSRELVGRANSGLGRANSAFRTDSHLGFCGGSELGSVRFELPGKSGEFDTKDEDSLSVVAGSGERVVPVKLGKFRNVEDGEGSSSSITCNVDSRRCFSMGSFAYVMDEASTLQVPITTPEKKQSSKKPHLPLTPGHRLAMSECGSESRREFVGFEGIKNLNPNGKVNNPHERNENNGSSIRKESFSISKIWLRGKREKANHPGAEDSSRRAISFRFPINRNVAVGGSDLKDKKETGTEIGRWENGGTELGHDEEMESCNSLDSLANNPPSFTRRTLLWLMGRQNRVGHSSSSTDV
ncbi:RING-H2 finger protein ATL13-like [Rhodamnia argentea]|uniref:RING-type E3 ubiquitin transferase n=1 Tax=Rhodamnia argentea TaxID=178133 RepID=A0ABM3HC56_9MYRT|nr:RING-H2 finger protein ATL13-like [Rhodamnia argentea]